MRAAQQCFAADAAGAARGLGAIFGGRAVPSLVPVCGGRQRTPLKVGVGITIALRQRGGPRCLRYFRVPEAWTKVEKLAWLAEQPFSSIAWRELTPDARHLWLTEGMHAAFATFLPLGTKTTKAGRATESEAIFKNYSNGLKTCRKDGVIINPALTLTGLPAACFGYRLGNRSALEWLIDQYQVSSDKRSGLTSDPNRSEDEEYIVRLVGRIVTVSIETVQLVEALAAWDVGVAGA